MVSEASPRAGLSEYETIPISEASHETTAKQSVQREDGSEALLYQGRYTSELEVQVILNFHHHYFQIKVSWGWQTLIAL